MVLLNGGLRAVFGAAFGGLFNDGVLHKARLTDDGAGGFTAQGTDSPAKILVESLSEQARAAGGLPRDAVILTVLRAGLPADITLDDSLTVNGATYRVIAVGVDAAGASFSVTGVPA